MQTSVWKPRKISHAVGSGAVAADTSFVGWTEQILMLRGFLNADSRAKLLKPKLSDLKSPMLLLGMKEACERLLKAHESQEKICIYADFDLDGTSGCALLKTAFDDLGFKNVLTYQPQRLSEGYGFHAHAVEELAAKGVSLIVTVDVGITANEACAKAKELGIDVILTDHHQPPPILPAAFTIVNPNQKDCKSELGYLCGAGVAFYLVRALKRTLIDAGRIQASQGDLRKYLDVLTIATLTDMVPLIDDNRALVKAGLIELARTERPGLRALLKELKLWGRPLSSQDVAIRFAPKLNALSRMENGVRPLDVYIAENDSAAQALMAATLHNNSTRVSLQAEGEKLALQIVAESSEADENFNFVVHSEFHRGVVGLIATKVAQATGKTTFIGSVSSEGMVVGSARNAEDSQVNIVKALESAQDFLNRFGGHPQAAGYEFPIENFAAIKAQLHHYFLSHLVSDQPRESFFDVEIPFQLVNESLLQELEEIGPFGQSFEVPILKIAALKIEKVTVLNGGHLKFVFSSAGERRNVEGIWFSPGVQNFKAGDEVQVLSEVQRNYFGGSSKLQVLIKEMQLNGSEKEI